jgi:hypothetical protein
MDTIKQETEENYDESVEIKQAEYNCFSLFDPKHNHLHIGASPETCTLQWRLEIARQAKQAHLTDGALLEKLKKEWPNETFNFWRDSSGKYALAIHSEQLQITNIHEAWTLWDLYLNAKKRLKASDPLAHTRKTLNRIASKYNEALTSLTRVLAPNSYIAAFTNCPNTFTGTIEEIEQQWRTSITPPATEEKMTKELLHRIKELPYTEWLSLVAKTPKYHLILNDGHRIQFFTATDANNFLLRCPTIDRFIAESERASYE